MIVFAGIVDNRIKNWMKPEFQRKMDNWSFREKIGIIAFPATSSELTKKSD